MITSVTVTNVATKALDGRRRRYLHIQNKGTVPVAVKYNGSDTALTWLNGIEIGPKLALLLGNSGGDQDFWHEVWFIHNSGAAEVSVVIHEGGAY